VRPWWRQWHNLWLSKPFGLDKADLDRCFCKLQQVIIVGDACRVFCIILTILLDLVQTPKPSVVMLKWRWILIAFLTEHIYDTWSHRRIPKVNENTWWDVAVPTQKTQVSRVVGDFVETSYRNKRYNCWKHICLKRVVGALAACRIILF